MLTKHGASLLHMLYFVGLHDLSMDRNYEYWGYVSINQSRIVCSNWVHYRTGLSVKSQDCTLVVLSSYSILRIRNIDKILLNQINVMKFLRTKGYEIIMRKMLKNLYKKSRDPGVLT